MEIFFMWPLLLSICFFLILYIQRAFISHMHPTVKFDTYFHMYLIDYIRDCKNKVPVYHRGFLSKKQKILYPYFFHYLLSFIPKKYNSFIEDRINIYLDAFLAVLLFYFLLLENDIYISCLLTMLFIFTPILFTWFSTGPRCGSFTPRVFGELSFSLIIFSLYMYMEVGGYIYIFISFLLSLSIWNGNQFTRQCFIGLIFIGLLLGDIYIVVLPFISCFFTYFLVGERYKLSLKQKYEHYAWYIKQLASGQIRLSQRSIMKWFFSAARDKSFRGLGGQINYYNPFLIILFKAPVFVLSLCVAVDIVLNSAAISNGKLFLCYMVITFFILFFATSTKWMLFLGESERYIIHIFAPSLLLLADANYRTLVICFFIYGVFFYLCEVLRVSNLKKKSNKNEILDCFVNKLNDTERKIATFPISLGGWYFLYKTKASVLTPFDVIFNYNRANCFKNYQEIDPGKLGEAIEFFEINTIVVDKEHKNSHVFLKKLEKLNFEVELQFDSMKVLRLANIRDA